MNTSIKNRNIIMSNYSEPTQYVQIAPKQYLHTTARINTCADKFEIFMKLKKNIVEDIVFSGEGCAIATASLNILSHYLISMNVNEAIHFINNYENFLNSQPHNKKNLKNLIVFSNISKHTHRIHCALMGAINIKILIDSNQ